MNSSNVLVLALVLVLNCHLAVTQDVAKVNRIIQSFTIFGAPTVDSMNVTQKVENTIHILKNNFEEAKAKGISLSCFSQLEKIFGPALPYVMKKDYSGLIKWLISSGVIYYVDAWGKPPSNIFMGHVKWNGAFDECSAISGAHYCLADMKLFGQNGTNGQYGICVPSQCSADDVSLLLDYTIPYLKNFVEFPADGLFKQNYGSAVLCNDKKKLPTDAVAFIVVFGLLVFLCFLGTLTEALQDCFTPDNLIPHKSLYNDEEHEPENVIPNSINKMLANGIPVASSNQSEDFSYSRFGTESTKVKMTRGNNFTNVLICFSVLKNMKVLLNAVPPKDSIRSINGIRAISMTWVLLGHVYFFGIYTPPDNVIQSFKINERFSYQAIANAYVSVDSFFFLSGFLVAYITLKKMDRINGKLNFFAFILHRFIRLTPSYMFAIFLQTSLYPYIVNSPEGLTVRAGAKNDNCHKYWWTNLLYINNFYPWKMMDECLGWSWYLANDMQFYVISPVILFIMFRYKLKGALITIFSGIFISTVISIVIIAANDLPSLISVAWLPDTPLDVRKKVGDFGDDFYVKPYTRINPYLVGLLLGYIISRKIYLTRKPNFAITFIGWFIATAFGMLVVYGPYNVFRPGGEMFNTAENIFYGSFSRLVWALALAWVVYACQHRMGGWINSFLSWNFWIPIGRLTYGAYLLHPIILNYFYKTMPQQWHFKDDTTIFHYFSVLITSYSLAMVMSLLIDLPVYNLETMLTKKLTKKE